MIFNSYYSTEAEELPGLSRVMGEIDEVCPRDPELRSRAHCVAEGVAAYLNSESRTAVLDTHHLRVLIARALFAAGEADLARRILLFGGGLVRRSSSIVVADPLWILDLECLAVRENERMDMLVTISLTAILETMGPVWDESGGQGVLGLRSVRKMALAVVGPDAGKRKAGRVEAEIRSVCRHKLELLGRKRGWDQRPQVMEMDGR